MRQSEKGRLRSCAVYILPPHERVTGWVAVSQLARTRNPTDYGWLDAYHPVERIGKTIDLYYIP